MFPFPICVMRNFVGNILVTTCCATLALSTASLADIRTIEVPLHMSCPMSDPPVYEALFSQVPGVRSVDISFEQKNARITFEDTETSAAQFSVVLREFIGQTESNENNMTLDEKAQAEDELDGM